MCKIASAVSATGAAVVVIVTSCRGADRGNIRLTVTDVGVLIATVGVVISTPEDSRDRLLIVS